MPVVWEVVVIAQHGGPDSIRLVEAGARFACTNTTAKHHCLVAVQVPMLDQLHSTLSSAFMIWDIASKVPLPLDAL